MTRLHRGQSRHSSPASVGSSSLLWPLPGLQLPTGEARCAGVESRPDPAPITENLFLFRAPTGCLCLAAGIRYLAGSIEHRQGGVGRHDGGERGVRGWLSRMASAVSHPVTDWPGFPVTTLVLIPPLCGLRHGAVGPGRCVQPTLLMAQDSFNAWPSQNKAVRAP